ncbi:MAG: STAS domain-containing protein [Gammaproteobacteria bacterium]|nr:STAS domain-containing protein [Gammaproteobacteria bacterium]
MSEASFESVNDGCYRLSGRVTFASVPALWCESKAMFSSPADSLKVDLKGVVHADSAGLALLIEWLRSARQVEKSISFEYVPEQLYSIAQVSKLGSILPLRRA